MPHRIPARVLMVVSLALAAFAASATGSAAVTRPSASRPNATSSARAAPVLSHYETATRALSRDIGITVVLPDGHDLWIFGDTGISKRNPAGDSVNTGFVDGSTALEARVIPGQVPHGGEFPLQWPSRLVPPPKDVYLPDGSHRDCVQPDGYAAFAARWPTGAAVRPGNTSELLVTYSEVCVTEPPGSGPQVRTEGWGYMLYDWRARRIALGPIDVFRPHANGSALAPSHVFGWPVFVGGHVTLFSSSCTTQFLTCAGGHVWSATTTTLSKPGSYHPIAMSTDGTAPWEPMSISVGKYGNAMRLIESTSIGGDYRIFGTPKLGVRWHLIHSGTLPDCVPNSVGYCHGIEGHPELSTPSQLLISYKDPNSGPGGHLVVSTVGLK